MFLRIWFVMFLVGLLALWLSVRSERERVTLKQILFLGLGSLGVSLVAMTGVWENVSQTVLSFVSFWEW